MIGSSFVDVERTTTAIDLLEQLIDALQLREEADPDSPSWLAEQEVRRLEGEIIRALRSTAWQLVPTRRYEPGIETATGTLVGGGAADDGSAEPRSARAAELGHRHRVALAAVAEQAPRADRAATRTDDA